MNASHRFTLLGLALAALLPLQPGKAADPEHKPKLAPRGIPGMSKGAAPTAQRPSAPTKATTFKSAQPAPQGDPSMQARIITVYRRGTIPLPPVANDTAAPAASQEISPSQPKVPPPGKVRILTKEEADTLVKQPEK